MEGPAQVNTEDDFAFCLPTQGFIGRYFTPQKVLTFASVLC